VHPEPLVDEKGIFGFKMEKLLAIDPDTAPSRSAFIECLQQIHKTGVGHNDFHPMNVMMDGEGQLVIIDFGRSGRIGTKIPMEKRSPWWRAELYSFNADYMSLNKCFCAF
jgi:predicted unusual protein kinase regulating ubiquinone biosynthesis (AarF/ABC1/UbiB family)